MSAQEFIDWVLETGMENITWTTDVDETLLEKSKNPNEVTKVEGLEPLCEALDDRAGGGFFIITGRDIVWLDKVFLNKNVRASCEYHCLFRKEAGEAPELLNDIPEWHHIDDELDAIVAQEDGLILRKKQFMRTLHYGKVPEQRRDDVKAAVEKKLEGLLEKLHQVAGQELSMVDGGKVFDMGPAASDKSHALSDVIEVAAQQSGRDDLIPVYFGDSPGDLPAAHLVKKLGGKFISVGDDPKVTEIADFKLDNPAQLRSAITSIMAGGLDFIANPDQHAAPGPQPPKP
jgi:trehalose-phosphatase